MKFHLLEPSARRCWCTHADQETALQTVVYTPRLCCLPVRGRTPEEAPAGAVMTEMVFAWPGTGRIMFGAILEHDYPVVLGVFLVVGVAVVLANLAVDLLYAVLDPRVRYA